MRGREIDKVLATQLLEATKNVLEDLNQWLIELGEQGEETAVGASQVYGKARRLRDYLQRSIATYSRTIEIDLDDQDTNLLVSCIVHHIGVLEFQMASGRAARGDLNWYREKSENLRIWAIEHATKPVERIPARDAIQLETHGVRGLVATIKSRTGVGSDASVAPPGTRISFQPQARGEAPRVEPLLAAPTGLHPSVAPEPPSRTGTAGVFLDPKQIADPRLRSLVAMDLGAFERTRASDHHRLAMVHLASVFEGVVVDHGLAHGKELGIKGPPETWRIEEIVRLSFAERLTSSDRAQLLQMVAARHLVRPAIQLTSPIVVTASTLDKAVTFVNRVLVEFGYAGSATENAGAAQHLPPVSGFDGTISASWPR